MAVTIGSNISALRTTRQLDRATANLASVSERLASGQRINKASDDAAGLAIASSLDVSSRLFTKALANVNDGISVVSITDGAMREMGTVLTRIRELATQSANGTYSPTQRRAIDEEAQKLAEEYARIGRSTKFNGLGLLDGSQQTIQLQVGTQGSSDALLALSSAAAAPDSSLRFDGVDDSVEVAEAPSLDLSGSATIAAWVRVKTYQNNDYFIADFESSGSFSQGSLGMLNGGGQKWLFYQSHTDSSSAQIVGNTAFTTDSWYHVAFARDDTNKTVTLYVNGAADGSVAYNGKTVSANATTANWSFGSVGDYPDFAAVVLDDVRMYNRALSVNEISKLAGGSGPSTGLIGHWKFDEGNGTTTADSSGNGNHGTLTNGPTWSTDTSLLLAGQTGLDLSAFSLLTATDARNAMDTIDTAFNRINSEIGTLGSQLSRLQAIINTVAAARENYQAAAGRIKDADVAQESAALTRYQILQQTASSVLAQANQQPRIALQLLGAV